MAYDQFVVGSKPWHHIWDGCRRFASYYVKRKTENKGSQMGQKIYLRKIMT
jgi:hypothetical protein